MAEETNSKRAGEEKEAKEGEAAATNQEASAIRRAAGAFKGWATTFDKERNKEQIESLKRGAQSVSRSVKTATVAVGGAVGSSAAAVSKPMIALAKSSSALLFILGLAHYFLRFFYPESTSLFVISFVLFIVAGFALAARLEKERVAILLPMLMFVIWYWVFDASISINIILSFLIIGGLIMLLVAFLTKGGSVIAELAGFVPVLFLFLDVGLIPFLVEKFDFTITPLIEGLVLYLPWWAYLGLFTLPEHPTDNKFLNGLLGLLKFGGIIWIVILVLSVSIPLASLEGGYDDTTVKVLPSIEKLEGAQARVKAKIGPGELFLTNLKCLGDLTGFADCVAQGKVKAEFEALCNEKEDVKSGATSLDDCVIEEQKKEQAQRAKVGGGVDDKVKATTLKIDIPVAPLKLTAKPTFLATLLLENPRQLSLDIVVNCTFKKDSTVIKGVVSERGAPMEQLPLTIKADTAQIPLHCSPTAELEAKQKTSYTVVVEATVKGMVTTSSLSRAFLGQVSELERKEITKTILNDKSGDFRSGKSLAPAEFARINFAFGSPEQNPVIASGDLLDFSSNVENVGGGRILAINSYSYDLAERGFVPNTSDCLTSQKLILPEDVREKVNIDTCFIVLPSDLTNFKGPPLVETFFATLNYDYAVKGQGRVDVQVIPVG